MIITGYHTLENKDNIDEVEMDSPPTVFRKVHG